jgi:hypothetical protein
MHVNWMPVWIMCLACMNLVSIVSAAKHPCPAGTKRKLGKTFGILQLILRFTGYVYPYPMCVDVLLFVLWIHPCSKAAEGIEYVYSHISEYA